MKKVIISCCVLALVACGSKKTVSENTAQAKSEASISTKAVAEKVSTKKDSPLLAEGNISVEELSKFPWYKASYDNYHPDEAEVKTFAKALKKHDYQIDVYMGTWCHDSQRVVPKLIKILEMTGSDFSNVSIVSVNGRKQIPNVSPEIAAQLNIQRVPTIIFYEDGKEAERFVEKTRESLIKDLTKIALGEAYMDRYEH